MVSINFNKTNLPTGLKLNTANLKLQRKEETLTLKNDLELDGFYKSENSNQAKILGVGNRGNYSYNIVINEDGTYTVGIRDLTENIGLGFKENIKKNELINTLYCNGGFKNKKDVVAFIETVINS